MRDSKIIGDNDDLEKKYLNTKGQLKLSDDYFEDWLMWYTSFDTVSILTQYTF